MVLDFLSRIWFRFYLGILWAVCCIPIVTFGAATTAYCGMLLRMKRGEEGYYTKGFFEIMKREWKQSTKVWGVMGALILVLYMDSKFISSLVNEYGGWYEGLVPVYYFLLILVFGELLYVFPYIAMFENSTRNVLKNSFLISTRHWGFTVTTMLMDGLLFWVMFRYVPGIVVIVPMILGWMNISMLYFVLRKYIVQNS